MFCPRCGTENKEGTRFCRQCGLPTSQLSEYVSTGGTASLVTPPSLTVTPQEVPEGLSPKQKMILAIIFFAMSPAIFGVLGEMIPGRLINFMTPFSAVTMPLWITWSVLHFKAKQRLWESRIAQQKVIAYTQQDTNELPPNRQAFLHVVQTQELANEREYLPPVSVTEDATIKLPENKKS